MWILIFSVAAIVLLVGYVVRRDRRRGRGTGHAAGSGEGRAAAESAQISRGANDIGGF